MVDPSDALTSFQQAIINGRIPHAQLHRGNLDSEILVHLDHPNEKPRFTYVKLKDKTVTALVVVVLVEPLNNTPCFHIGYAVPELYRGQNLAKNLVKAAIAELKSGMARQGVDEFYLEAIVGVDNAPSNNIAKDIISNNPTNIIDSFSGLPALQYITKIE